MPTTTRAFAIMAIAASLPVSMPVLMAGESGEPGSFDSGSGFNSSYDGHSSLAEREIIRRQAAVKDADRLLNEGREAYAAGDFQQASDKYSQALQKLPAGDVFAERRAEYIAHQADANIALAMVYSQEGRYDEARSLLEDVLANDPDNKIALRELDNLGNSLRSNPALTPEYVADVKKVNASLTKAEGAFDLGKFDEAKSEYESVIRVDPYNKTARRGLERVASIKSDYYRTAYDHARAELLMQVDKAWEITVPQDSPQFFDDNSGGGGDDSGVAYITEKLRRIIIPSINFEDTTVEDAINFLRLRAAELDTVELDPTKKGVNFVIRKPRSSTGGDPGGLDATLGDAMPLGGGDPSALRIPELRVRNVPLAVALKYICDATKLRYKVDDFAVTLVPQTETGEEFFSRTFTVPPDFASKLNTGDSGGGGADIDPFSDTGGGGGRNLIEARPPIDQLLKTAGISFNEGASATLTGSALLVTNTPTELDKIEQLVDTIVSDQPKQVKITTKFVEVTQENGEELGFDWVIGPFSSGDGNLVGAGGTLGNAGTRTGLDFSGPAIPGVTPGSSSDVSNVATAGNRSGAFAISGNSIDAILNNTNRAAQSLSVAPGIMSLTGLFSEGQLKVIMRGLSQKKGIDLMTAPSITARSGEKATIEIIREFIYPTEYDPPELPGGGGGGNNNGGSVNTARIVTPANPTAFETRNTGVTLEIEPTLGDGNNNFMIDLQFVPEIVEFEGFINYGSPITTPGLDEGDNEISILLTENRIEMPVFSTRRVNTALTIYDGYTVAIGGLMREDVQNVEDKVPLLGDIPFIGRLFQTKAENRIKSNLILFVTAQIIDPTGRPIRGGDDDMEMLSAGTSLDEPGS